MEKVSIQDKLVERRPAPGTSSRLFDSSKEYEATMRLQPGSFGIAPQMHGWQEKKKLSSETKPRWVWILVPQLDRLGNQPIALEAMIYDLNGKLVGDINPLIKRIEVVNPLGIAPWIVYLISIIGGVLVLPLGTWCYQEISLRLKEKREDIRKQEDKKKSVTSKRRPKSR
jgi:hypothetical protein